MIGRHRVNPVPGEQAMPDAPAAGGVVADPAVPVAPAPTAPPPADRNDAEPLPQEPGPVPRAFGRAAFAHPAEAEFAGLMDFYRVRWEYEPTSFPVRWEDGRALELFTPDFYLPEHDLYVELTTMKQSLITRKHRKLRRMKEAHPEVNVVLLTRRDYYELLARVGYGAVDITSLPEADIERVLYSPVEIADRVAELGAQISADYAGRSIVLVGVLKGVTFFLADLARAITRPLAIDFLAVAPWREEQVERVRWSKDLDLDISGRDVLLIEDIATTGLTLDFVVSQLRQRGPASLDVCVLFDKRERRLIDVPVRYTGFTIPNAYVVGYGLDYRQLYRNLPFLCVLKPEVYARDHASRLAEANGYPPLPEAGPEPRPASESQPT